MKRIFLLMFCAVMLAGCSKDAKDYMLGVDNRFVQIGCADFNHGGSPNIEKATPFLRIGFPWWRDPRDSKSLDGLSAALLLDAGNKGHGLAVAPMLLKNYMSGVAAGGVIYTRYMRGLSIAIFNWAGEEADVQLGVINTVYAFWQKSFARFQLGVFNLGNAFCQIGILNENPEEQNCRQIGLMNFAESGRQFGLLNFNKNAKWFKFFPVINFSD